MASKLFKGAFGEIDGRQHGMERGDRPGVRGGRRWSPASLDPLGVCQKCAKSVSIGQERGSTLSESRIPELV